MHRGRVVIAGVGLAGLVSAASPAVGVRAAAAAVPDPSTWSDAKLAAQLVVACVDSASPAAIRAAAASGVGGITLLGRPTSRLGSAIAAARVAAPGGLPPLVGSDEEGGLVQRLRTLVYPLPSAKVMGTWSVARVRSTATAYGLRMRALGVLMDYAPVADLGIPGYYIDSQQRAFSADPKRVADVARAWSSGLAAARIVPVVKHWPGHGQAVNSHTGIAVVPPLSTLVVRDMVPFDAAFAAGAPVVMVGHLRSAGLTEPGVPASESPRALRYLRSRAGPDAVIVTDSLTMAAASSALGISPATAAVRALYAGADWAMGCTTSTATVVSAVRAALTSGRLPRAQAVASARRILALKRRAGLIA